jgi:hypothetical protein
MAVDLGFGLFTCFVCPWCAAFVVMHEWGMFCRLGGGGLGAVALGGGRV